MPSVTYMNQSAPFWDFIASLEQQGTQHPMFSQWAQQNENAAERGENAPNEHPPPPPPFGNPWGWGFPGWGGRAFPHRGPPGPPPQDENMGEKDGEKEKEKDKEDNDNGEGPSGSGSDTEGRTGRRGRCGGRRGRHCGPHGRGGPFGPGAHHGPPHGGPWGWGHGRRGGLGGRGPWGRGPFNPIAFAANLFEASNTADARDNNEDFSPDADIFDTPEAFVIHVSLPGAKKEDVGVNWDAEKSELSIAGVIYRPGDEEFLATLAMDERKVGPFERKIRLGTRANPAQVDAEGIAAKLEDGVLRVEVPKLGETGFVEVRKVDIE